VVKLKFKDRQITGNVGLFYISYRLSRMGWNVLPTSRNAKGIDILSYGKDGETFHTIQAKGYTDIEAIGPFKKKTEVIADYYIIASSVYQAPGTYILTKEEVREHLTPHEGVYWLEIKDYKKPEFLEKWDKIGFGFVNDSEIEQIIKIDHELNYNRNL